MARALAVEIDIVPGRPAACGALIGVNFWACCFFGGGVVSPTSLGFDIWWRSSRHWRGSELWGDGRWRGTKLWHNG